MLFLISWYVTHSHHLRLDQATPASCIDTRGRITTRETRHGQEMLILAATAVPKIAKNCELTFLIHGSHGLCESLVSVKRGVYQFVLSPAVPSFPWPDSLLFLL